MNSDDITAYYLGDKCTGVSGRPNSFAQVMEIWENALLLMMTGADPKHAQSTIAVNVVAGTSYFEVRTYGNTPPPLFHYISQCTTKHHYPNINKFSFVHN